MPASCPVDIDSRWCRVISRRRPATGYGGSRRSTTRSSSVEQSFGDREPAAVAVNVLLTE
jgi:hypothetical protein